MDVYFDTNVYGHIYRRDDGVTDEVVKKLDEGIQGKTLRVFNSFPVIEETNAARLSNLDETNGRLELIRTLTVQNEIIKRQPEIIDGDMRAYVQGHEAPSKFQEPYPGLSDIFWDHTAKHYKELEGYARDTNSEVTAFAKDLDDSFSKVVRPMAKEAKESKQQQPFPEYLNEMEEPWLEQLAKKYGMLDECKPKGLRGLLDVHSIRVTTRAQLSLTYSNMYEKEKFERGNSRDMHHVACASAVPVFVTHDKALTRLLIRKLPPDLEVMNLKTLLDRF
jgi:predicted nucleic acid-binding protein